MRDSHGLGRPPNLGAASLSSTGANTLLAQFFLVQHQWKEPVDVKVHTWLLLGLGDQYMWHPFIHQTPLPDGRPKTYVMLGAHFLFWTPDNGRLTCTNAGLMMEHTYCDLTFEAPGIKHLCSAWPTIPLVLTLVHKFRKSLPIGKLPVVNQTRLYISQHALRTFTPLLRFASASEFPPSQLLCLPRVLFAEQGATLIGLMSEPDGNFRVIVQWSCSQWEEDGMGGGDGPSTDRVPTYASDDLFPALMILRFDARESPWAAGFQRPVLGHAPLSDMMNPYDDADE
ncbi:hypothetical protein F5887DRAFT_917545 [Amanita rubescens]|nr:hypothetical protein F5887DRAFT_917545 [Amanita rubescens]